MNIRAALVLFLALAPVSAPHAEQVQVREAKVYRRPELVTRAFPMVQNVDMSRRCSVVRLTAEIKGPEAEGWYCPRVEWEKPDGTRAVTESDCPPFERRNECYPARGAECALDWHVEDGRFVVDGNPCGCVVPGYPRAWPLEICAPAHPAGEMWSVRVRLTKNGETLAQDSVRFLVK